MIHTLVVDDEQNIREFICEALERVGHLTTQAKNGEEALEILRDQFYDLAVLDLNLGGKTNGLRVLEALRWRWPETAAIILTGQGSLESAMQAIREGVDVYLLKPVATADLRQAAGEAIEKRRMFFAKKADEAMQPVIKSGPIFIDVEKRLTRVDGKEVLLTPREFTLLLHLVKNAHRVIPPKELSQVVGDFTPESQYEARQYIKWYVHELRKKIEMDPVNPQLIATIREGGYRYIGGEQTQ
jgi:two-component system KDP operon response regulator KdpE